MAVWCWIARRRSAALRAAVGVAIAWGALSGGAQAQQAKSEPETYVLYFDFASAKLSAKARPIITDAAAAVERAKSNGAFSHVKVIGYADSAGTAEGADRLSERRADAVRSELIRDGVAPEEIKTEGRGKREPEVNTGDQVKNPRNRRVRIVIYRPGD
ncbi:MAG TPA: OmpA family protein [Stellaceae bacterium]|nr:OmpA family protein [Stellaceae bacterium]